MRKTKSILCLFYILRSWIAAYQKLLSTAECSSKVYFWISIHFKCICVYVYQSTYNNKHLKKDPFVQCSIIFEGLRIPLFIQQKILVLFKFHFSFNEHTLNHLLLHICFLLHKQILQKNGCSTGLLRLVLHLTLLFLPENP